MIEKVITNYEGLSGISDEWHQLAKISNASPFQFPEWIIPWWKFFGSGELLFYNIFENDRLSFIAPLYIRHLDYENERKLVFIGTGNSDYLDVICKKEDAGKYLSQLFNFLHSIRDRFDLMDFQEINEKSSLLSFSFSDIFNVTTTEGDICHRVRLPDNFEKFLMNFSKGRVKNLLRMERKLAAEGGFEFREAEEEDIEEFINESAILNDKRWSVKNNSEGLLNSDEVKKFNTESVINFKRKNMAHLLTIRNMGRTIATEYLFCLNDYAYDYIHSNNPDYEKFSPGFLMRLKTIEYLINRGIKTFDFLRGDEPYKKDWETYTSRNYRMVITLSSKV
jgi:CelD/BcsL family acetyltransferase involved in cellulose biosynthesis